jgi:hypothetical protein
VRPSGHPFPRQFKPLQRGRSTSSLGPRASVRSTAVCRTGSRLRFRRGHHDDTP